MTGKKIITTKNAGFFVAELLASVVIVF